MMTPLAKLELYVAVACIVAVALANLLTRI